MQLSIFKSFATAAMVALTAIGAQSLETGKKAPLFEAQSSMGNIRSADYVGKKHLVLAFYYADFTSTWTNEMLAFQNDLQRFEKLNAQVMGVSPDSIATHNEFANKYGLKFPLVADESGKIQKLYAPGRVTFIIDKTGTVRFIQNGVPDNETLLNELSKL